MITVNADKLIYSYSRHWPPAATINSGDSAEFITHDRFPPGADLRKLWSTDRSPVTAVTGPLAIADARPGDTVAITITELEIFPHTAAIFAAPGKGLWGDSITTPTVRRLTITESRCHLTDHIAIPLHPHIGRIATAPAEGEYPTATIGPFGGNMDIVDVTPGATVFLPVFSTGAQISIGDLHAAMGDGECCGSAVEIAGRVVIQCDVVKITTHRPMIQTADELMCVADGISMEEAIALAAADMHSLLKSQLQVSDLDASFLISSAVDLRICQVVNPRYTVRAVISRDIVPGLL